MFAYLKPIFRFLFFSLLALVLQSCRLFGIHLKVENPKKAGSYPEMTETHRLLANPGYRRERYDVKYNRLNISIDPKKKILEGTVTITAVWLEPVDSIQVDLFKNLLVKKVLLNNKESGFVRKEGAIFIKALDEINVGQAFTLTLEYEGKPLTAKRPPWKGGAVWKKDKDGFPWCGVACETEGASIWWPNKDDPSDEADSTDISLTVPAQLVAVSNGTLRKVESRVPGKKTFHWHISYPINNYNVTYYIGNFKCIEDTFLSKESGKIISLKYYVLPKHMSVASSHFQQVKKHILFFEKVFGPYPWPDDGYKLIESPYAGMEHQTAIAYGNKYKNCSHGFDYIILHETAHEWWGNSVTAADLSDVWLQEGFASYAEALYVESLKGEDAYLDYLFWQRVFIINKRPVVRTKGLRYFDSKDEDVYVKGSWVLHSLRTVIQNDSVFFDILRNFRIQNHQKQIFTEQFIDLVNLKTNSDYTWFFDQYLYRREAPILEYHFSGAYVYYRWTHANNEFSKLPVTLQSDDSKMTIYPSTEIQRTQVNGNFYQFSFNDDKVYYGVEKNIELKYFYLFKPSLSSE